MIKVREYRHFEKAIYMADIFRHQRTGKLVTAVWDEEKNGGCIAVECDG
ncbi:hypothetical protein [Macrococcus animalis]